MIKVTVYTSTDEYFAYDVEGHANFDELGSDIVCAAVSTLAQTTLVALNEVAEIEEIEFVMLDGVLSVDIPSNLTEKQLYDSQIIFKVFIKGIKGIDDAYPDYIQLLIKEVETNVNSI